MVFDYVVVDRRPVDHQLDHRWVINFYGFVSRRPSVALDKNKKETAGKVTGSAVAVFDVEIAPLILGIPNYSMVGRPFESSVLAREDTDPKFSVVFYKGVIQAVLL